MIRSIFVACATLAAASILPALAAERSCKLVRLAEWPVRLERNLPVIDGAIDGKKIGILLDTGAYASLLMKDTAEKFGLFTTMTSASAVGFGGESRILITRFGELRIGEAVRHNMRVRVAGERPIPGVDFILGDDFFKAIDLEFDYAKGMIRLFQAQNCENAVLAYWDANASRVPMEREDKIVLPVKINGHEARALLDSGAAGSVISLAFAARLGISPQSAGVVESGCSAGIGEGLVHAWVAPFESVEIGGETIRNPHLRMEDYMPSLAYARNAPPELILGTDFLRAHRVLVARSQGKVYISYAGGLVFPATPSLACSERARTKQEARAEYDAALEKDPADVKALVGRAATRERDGDRDGALADLDAAIRLQPRNAVALYARARIRAFARQYDDAMADLDAAIANGMRNGAVYVNRASIRSRQGDVERALLEYDEALRLDPTHRPALRARGRYNYLTARYEAADRDYTALLDVPHTPYDAIWLELSRARRGADARSALEREAAALAKGAWPAPILAFYLDRLDRDALIAAAEGGEEKARAARLCEARFYAAQRLLLRGTNADARALLEKARGECPRQQIEYEAALVELKRMP